MSALLEETPAQTVAVEENLGLVHACAHRLRGRGIEYDDLFSAGCIGLCKAAGAFDAGRGVCFSTYAVPVILGEMRRLFRDGGTVKVSRSLKEMGQRVQRAREGLCAARGREPTIAEIAAALSLEPEQVAQAAMASSPVLSLTDSDEEGGGQIDLPVESPEERISDRLSLEQVLAALPENDRRLIRLRYYARMTQSQTAALLGMTQVQVSRREKKLLLQMRQQLIV